MSDSRERFENWAKENRTYPLDTLECDLLGDMVYSDPSALADFALWQACEAQFVVELPKPFTVAGNDYYGIPDKKCFHTEEVLSAIEAAGGRCK